MNPTVTRVIQLATLASVIDDKASPEELNVITTHVAKAYEVPEQDVKTLADKLVQSYVKNGLASDPIAVVRRGTRTMRRLSGKDRRTAMDIAQQVAAATGGTTASEASLLEGIRRAV